MDLHESNVLNFNPRSPCGERRAAGHALFYFQHHFNPRSPCGERLNGAPLPLFLNNFNPRSPCGERHEELAQFFGDVIFQSTLPVWGATGPGPRRPPPEAAFQSTLPVWGATDQIKAQFWITEQFQSTLPVWGATIGQGDKQVSVVKISIHAPRVGSDALSRGAYNYTDLFQSTLPVWGATVVPPPAGGGRW